MASGIPETTPIPITNASIAATVRAEIATVGKQIQNLAARLDAIEKMLEAKRNPKN